MKRTKRIWALMLALLATLCLLPGAAMAEGEYCYWHKDSEKCPGYYTYYQRSIHRSLDMSPAFGEKGGNILPAVYLLYEGESKDNPTKGREDTRHYKNFLSFCNEGRNGGDASHK